MESRVVAFEMNSEMAAKLPSVMQLVEDLGFRLVVVSRTHPEDMRRAVLVCMDRLCLLVGFFHRVTATGCCPFGRVWSWDQCFCEVKYIHFNQKLKGHVWWPWGCLLMRVPIIASLGVHYWQRCLEWFLGYRPTLNVGDTLLTHRRNNFCLTGANGQNEVLTGISLSQTDKTDNKCHLAAIQEIGFRDRHMDLKNKHWVLWKGNYKDCSVSKEKQCGALELWSFCSALNGAFFQHEV